MDEESATAAAGKVTRSHLDLAYIFVTILLRLMQSA
jgi:hypothetical protein